MGLLRKRTSKASLKAAKDDGPRLVTPPPQLPPLPAHIRRSESQTEKEAAAQAGPPPGNRRRSRSLWGPAPPRLPPSFSTTTLGRRDSLGSPRTGTSGTTTAPSAPTSPEAQPWRSRETWAALHTPSKPAVLNELTFPCAPGSAAPGWRGRGGGGFFGGEGDEIEKERVRAPSRSQSRTGSRYTEEPAPPLPMSPSTTPLRSLYSPVPTPASRLPRVAPAPTPAAPTRKPPPPPSDPANAPTPELAKSPSPSPESAPSVRSIVSAGGYDAAAYAEAAGIASPSTSEYTEDAMHSPIYRETRQQHQQQPQQQQQLPTSAVPFPRSSPHLNQSPAMAATPGLTVSPSLSAVSAHLPVTPRVAHRVPSHETLSPATPLLSPNSSATTTLADSRSTPWGAASRSTTPILQRAISASSIASANLTASVSSAAPAYSPVRGTGGGGGPKRLPPPSYTQSEDGHARLRPEKVEHFVEHRTSLPESNPMAKLNTSRTKNPSPAPVPDVGETIDFTRPPVDNRRPSPQPVLASGPQTSRGANPPHVVSGYPVPSSNTLSASQNTNSQLPSRTPSNSSLNSGGGHSQAQLARLPSDRERDYGQRQRTTSRAEQQRAPSRTERAPSRTDRAPSRTDRAPSRTAHDRPPSRSTSSQGHSTSEHVPYTPNAIANAVNAWRTKNGGGKKSVEELGLMPGQHPSSRARTPSSGHGHGTRSRTRSAASVYSAGHGNSSLGLSGKKLEKLEVAPEWPARDVGEDPFAAAQHPWEAAYDMADYTDDPPPEFTSSPEDTSSDTEEARGPMAFPLIDEMPAAGGELPPPIEPRVQKVDANSVMQAHVQMSVQLQKNASLPQERQHYHRPQQEREPHGLLRAPSDPAMHMSASMASIPSSAGPMRMPQSPPMEQHRVLSPPMQNHPGMPQPRVPHAAPPGGYRPRPPQHQGYPPAGSQGGFPPPGSQGQGAYPPVGSQPARLPSVHGTQGQAPPPLGAPLRLPQEPPRPQQAPQQAPQPARQFPPNGHHQQPQPQHPQHAQHSQPQQPQPQQPQPQHPQPQHPQHAPHPQHPQAPPHPGGHHPGGPQRLPQATRQGAFPPPQQIPRQAPYPGGPPQHLYRPTGSRPFKPAPAPPQAQHPQHPHPQHQHHHQPKQLAANGHPPGYHHQQRSGSSNGHHAEAYHYKQPSGDSNEHPQHMHYKQMSGEADAHGYAPQQYAPAQPQWAQHAPPHTAHRLPPGAQPQGQPRMPMPAYKGMAAALSQPMPPAMAQPVPKSPRMPQSVAQGGWI